ERRDRGWTEPGLVLHDEAGLDREWLDLAARAPFGESVDQRLDLFRREVCCFLASTLAEFGAERLGGDAWHHDGPRHVRPRFEPFQEAPKRSQLFADSRALHLAESSAAVVVAGHVRHIH